MPVETRFLLSHWDKEGLCTSHLSSQKALVGQERQGLSHSSDLMMAKGLIGTAALQPALFRSQGKSDVLSTLGSITAPSEWAAQPRPYLGPTNLLTSQHPLGRKGWHHAIREPVQQHFVEDHKVIVPTAHGGLEAL